MNSMLRSYKNVIIFIVFFIIIVVGTFYIFNSMEHDNNDIALITLSDTTVVISNDLPMTDEVGKAIDADSNKVGTTGYLEFEVKSNVDSKIRYEIYLTKNSVKAEVPQKFVKVYLTDSNDMKLKNYDRPSVFYDLENLSGDKDSKVVFSGTLKGNTSQRFRLRMWVADTYELTSDARKFSVKLNVRVK